MYQNYHRHSYHSNITLTDSSVSNEDYAKRAVELGHSILSSCEHGNQGNYFQCYELASKYNLHFRYVAEAYFVKDRHEKDRTNCHIILAAKTEKGKGDLNEAISTAYIDGFYFRPRVDLEILLSLDPKDVFVTTACMAGIWQYGDVCDEEKKHIRYDWKEPDQLVMTLHKHFQDSFMLEVQCHDVPKQKEINKHILELYQKYGIKMIFGADSHYIYPEQAQLRDMRLKANGLFYDDEEGCFMDYPSEDEVFERFRKQGVFNDSQIKEALDNTNVFLTFEDIVLNKDKKLPTLYPNLTQEERNEKFKELIRQLWRQKRLGIPRESWREYEEGIKYELNTIVDTNTSDYFLLDYEIVKHFKEIGGHLTMTGRGSAPSYYINNLLGFTSIDRFALPVTMYPDRFISKDRLLAGNLPDIDMNVGNADVFAEAQADVMGEWHSAPMIAYNTLQRSAAWKMYCRATNIDFETANKISESLQKYEKDYKHADEDEREKIDPYNYVPTEYSDILRGSEEYLGVISQASPHPCAYLLCNNDIRREIGIIRLKPKAGSTKPVYAAFIEGAMAEAFGYLKNDDLSVTVVEMNSDIYKKIGIKQPEVPELMKLIENDKATWDIYAKGFTLGVNQVEKQASKQKLVKYKPHNFTEMAAFVAAIRPAFQSKLNDFLERKKFDYDIPQLDELLQTQEMKSSWILYQEQMMKVIVYAGFTPADSYAAIKAIAKKHPEKVLPLKEKFLAGFKQRLVDNGIDETKAKDTSDKVWTIISDACSYGFNSCLSGDTIIKRNNNNKCKPLTIKELYMVLNDKDYAVRTNHNDLRDKYRRYGYGYALSLSEDKRIHQNKIVDIRYQGIRKTYLITTKSGRSVVCTDNHKFPVDGYDLMIQAKDLKIGNKLYAFHEYERPDLDEIVSIEEHGEEEVFDVEMQDPDHNFVIDNGLVVGNSHACAVALDSLYTAYAKAHYPFETYSALLETYLRRKDKNKIDACKQEIKEYLGITVTPPKFREDNRNFYVDKNKKVIADTLISMKGMSSTVASQMYNIGRNFNGDFIDLLLTLQRQTTVGQAAVEMLIKAGYFSEFGDIQNLLRLSHEFHDGSNRITKTLKPETVNKRIAVLKQLLNTEDDGSVPFKPIDQLRFETRVLGTPRSTFNEFKNLYFVTDVDTTYGCKMYLYNCGTGTTGIMKTKKNLYQSNPVEKGDIIRITKWDYRPVYKYQDGKRTADGDRTELWLLGYSKQLIPSNEKI